MKNLYRVFFIISLVLCHRAIAQHNVVINAQLDTKQRIINIEQELTYNNTSADTLNYIVLNDWNNAYSSKTTPMARRFTDEFIKAFHLAKDADRGATAIRSFTDQKGTGLEWHRPDGHPDLVYIKLKSPIFPGNSFTITASYEVKIANDRFTHFGYNSRTGNYNLRDWYLSPARYEHGFVQYSNENLDDIANAAANYTFNLKTDLDYTIFCDLKGSGKEGLYHFYGTNRTSFNLIAEKQISTEVFTFNNAIVYSNLADKRVNDVERSIVAGKVVRFIENSLGNYNFNEVVVTQADYDRNPIYGLNQLPSFIRPFPDSFIYELKFLKTFVSAILRNNLKVDPRKDNWVYNFMEMALVTRYLNENYPDEKITGNLSTLSLLKGHHIFNIGQNDQYQYVYLLMARKNLDQSLGNSKDTFIKFNEQIANKYKIAQSIKHLEGYLGNDVVIKTVREFYQNNSAPANTNRHDLELQLQKNTQQDVSWFFNHLVDSRELVDYKIACTKKEKDSVTVTLKNVTGTPVPLSLYGLKKRNVVFKQWINAFEKDTTITIARNDADRLAINYGQEMTEYNPRNNQKTLKSFYPNRRPFKFSFFQDMEDPNYNQIFYVPAFTYNLYDGLTPGLRLHNKTLLEKPFIFDVSGLYSPNTQQLVASANLMYNHYIRDGYLYNVRYSLSGNTFHYTTDARYYKFVPMVQMRFRPDDFRKNLKEYLTLRQVTVERRPSAYVLSNSQSQSYSAFNARYSYINSNISHHNNFNADVQLSDIFGRLSGEYQYRHLFNDNRQVNLRFFGGVFMYRDTNNNFFSFGLDRASDYLFDYNYYGRSETRGLFSQQFIMADGGFKSMLDNRYVNQWMTTVNASFNIWNWIELYGDAGLTKSKYSNTRFVYDSGVRLNLVTDYFELYFPMYSSNGFEPSIGNYSQKIRFVVTLSPGTLLGLFTRKWF